MKDKKHWFFHPALMHLLVNILYPLIDALTGCPASEYAGQ